ncbi:MAG TPA: hypothetical protein VM681_04385 [Candidatus Thermoplasmatota archaeon]|nr:hypothetical protein [Candidatus Thermoplasmatota archaeon]
MDARISKSGRDFVIVAPGRRARPSGSPADACPFCPGQEHRTPPETSSRGPPGRAPGKPGWRSRAFPNAFPLSAVHEVVVESPAHAAPLESLSVEARTEALGLWRERVAAAEARSDVASVVLFRNDGGAAGASQPHPHSQIVGLPFVPPRVADEAASDRCAIEEELSAARADLARVIEDGTLVAFCPAAPRFPFETWIAPARHDARFAQASDDDLASLSQALGRLLPRIRGANGRPDLNLVLHTAPQRDAGAFHWHVEILPVGETLGGLERGAGAFVNPVAPETAARVLRGD